MGKLYCLAIQKTKDLDDEVKAMLAFIGEREAHFKKDRAAQGHEKPEDNPPYKIGIIYSANNEQALALLDTAWTHAWPTLKGSGQAKLFARLFSALEVKAIKGNVHILPIATSLHGSANTSHNTVNEAILQRDLANIYYHLQEGFDVIALISPAQKPDAPGPSSSNPSPLRPRYLIGGGSSRYFYDKQHAPVVFEHQSYSQGDYVALMLDLMQAYFNDGDEKAHARLEAALGVPQITPDNVSFFVSHAIREALVKKSQLPHAYAEKIQSASLSPSYNLRIQCAVTNAPGTSALDKVKQVLSLYGAQSLNDIRKEKVAKDEQIQPMTSQATMLSIHYDNVYAFLKAYCDLPLASIKSLYESEIQVRQNAKSVTLRGREIVLGRKVYTLEAFIQKGKTGYSKKTREGLQRAAQQRLKHETLHPEYAQHALSQLMQVLRDEEEKGLGGGGAPPTPPATLPAFDYGYMPLIVLQEAPHKRSWSGEIALKEKILRVQRELQKGATPHDIASLKDEICAYLKDEVILLFNTLSVATWEKYAALWPRYSELGALAFFSEKAPVPERTAVNHWGDCLYHQVAASLGEVDPLRTLIRAWMYQEVALLSYIKGNYFLFVTLWGALHDLHRQLEAFSFLPQPLMDFLDGIKKSPMQLQDRQAHYHRHYGITVPYLYPYSKHAVFEQSREGVRAEHIAKTIDEALAPLLARLHTGFSQVKTLSFQRNESLLEKLATYTFDPTQKPKTLPKGHLDKTDTDLRFVGTFLEENRLYHELWQTFQAIAKYLHIPLAVRDEVDGVKSILTHFAQLLRVDRTVDGKDDTVVAFPLRGEAWELAENVLFFNLSHLNTPMHGGAHLDGVIYAPEKSPEFAERAKALVEGFALRQAHVTHALREEKDETAHDAKAKKGKTRQEEKTSKEEKTGKEAKTKKAGHAIRIDANESAASSSSSSSSSSSLPETPEGIPAQYDYSF